MAENDLDNDFETYLDRVNCYNVMHLDYKDRCHFVQTVPSCKDAVNYIPYVEFMECYLKANSRFAEWVAIVVLISLVLYLGLIIAIVADSFFGPALKVIANLLRMSDHLAGVTLLAFGNSSADLLSNIAAIGEGDPMFTNCMSNSIFITMVAGGLVCYLRPFQLKGYETVRDVMFFLAGLLFLDYATRDNQVGRVESACFIGIYVLYIIVNVVDIYLENRELKKEEKKLSEMNNEERPKSSKAIQYRRQASVIDFVRRPSSTPSGDRTSHASLFTTRVSKPIEYVDVEATKYALYDRAHRKNFRLFRDFIDSLKPFTREEWKESSLGMKIFLILKTPVCLITSFCIPVVDVEADKHGWSKLLNCLQIIINIPMGLVITKNQENVDYMLYSLIITSPIALIVFIHSRTDVPPFYHILFAIFACSSSLFFIYASATEIESILTLVGNILALTDDFGGATISAWGGAIGDIIANVVLALQGYEAMAFAACFGGPFFTLLISSGVVYSVESWESPTGITEVDNGSYVENVFFFLSMALSTTLLWSTTFNFQARRSVGIFSLALYVVYLIFAVLAEKEVIHTFNPDEPIEIS